MLSEGENLGAVGAETFIYRLIKILKDVLNNKIKRNGNWVRYKYLKFFIHVGVFFSPQNYFLIW